MIIAVYRRSRIASHILEIRRHTLVFSDRTYVRLQWTAAHAISDAGNRVQMNIESQLSESFIITRNRTHSSGPAHMERKSIEFEIYAIHFIHGYVISVI